MQTAPNIVHGDWKTYQHEAERVRALLQECMEGVMRLSVPLRTDISVGRNWRECK